MDILFGFISNASSVILTAPIDVIKTNYQLKRNQNIKSICIEIYNMKGLRGFYSGVIPNLSTYPIFWATFFGSNQLMNNYKFIDNNYLDKFIKSYIAGTIGSTLTNPLFVIKTRIQNTERMNTSIIKDLNKLGYQSYFKGLGSTSLNNVKLSIQFPLYDYLKDITQSVLISSFLSKVISSTLFYPLDLIRINQRNSDLKLGIIEIIKTIYKKNGFLGLYRGVLLYNAVTTPNFVIMMFLYEFLKRNLK